MDSGGSTSAPPDVKPGDHSELRPESPETTTTTASDEDSSNIPGDANNNSNHGEDRPIQSGIHPFIQNLIQQHQLQQRLQNPSAGHQHQQQWLQALSSQLLLPGLNHPFLKNYGGQQHGAMGHPRAPMAPHVGHQPQRQFAPEFMGLHQNPRLAAQHAMQQQQQQQQELRRKSASLSGLSHQSCVVCRKPLEAGDSDCLVLESLTLTASNVTFSEKLEDIVGFSLNALGRSADFICKRCMGLISLVDRIELELSAAKEQVIILFRQGNFGAQAAVHRHHHQQQQQHHHHAQAMNHGVHRHHSGTEGPPMPSGMNPMGSMSAASSSSQRPNEVVNATRVRDADSDDENSEPTASKRRALVAVDDHSVVGRINGGSPAMTTPSSLMGPNEQFFERRRSRHSGGTYEEMGMRRRMLEEEERVKGLVKDENRPSDDLNAGEDDAAPSRLRNPSTEEPTNDHGGEVGPSSETESDSVDDEDEEDDDEDEDDVDSDDVTNEDAEEGRRTTDSAPAGSGIIDLSTNQSPANGSSTPVTSRQQRRRVINCDFCDESFKKSHHYEYHLNKAHLKEAPYRCFTCGKQFFSDVHLTSHMGRRTHFGPNPEERLLAIGEDQSFFDSTSQGVRWRCRVCDRHAKTKGGLRFHVAMAHVAPRGRLLCRLCGRGFMVEAALEAHANKEHSKAELMASRSAKLGPVVARLHAAAAAAGGPPGAPPGPPMTLPPPGAVFPFERKFGAMHLGGGGPPGVPHSQGPGGPPVVACPLCLMLFPSEGSLMQHQRSGACPGGMAAVSAALSLNPFAAAAAGAPPRDPMLAPHQSPSASSISMMNQMKSFLCRNCGEAYRTKDALDRHLWLVHSIKAENVIIYHCEECGKEYTKKQRYDTHMMLHRGERPHRCPYCKYDTNIRGNLRLHVKNVHKVELPLMRRKRGQESHD